MFFTTPQARSILAPVIWEEQELWTVAGSVYSVSLTGVRGWTPKLQFSKLLTFHTAFQVYRFRWQ